MYIFEKGGGSFGAVQVEKVKSLGAAQAEKWGGFRAAHTRTALIWEYTRRGGGGQTVGVLMYVFACYL